MNCLFNRYKLRWTCWAPGNTRERAERLFRREVSLIQDDVSPSSSSKEKEKDRNSLDFFIDINETEDIKELEFIKSKCDEEGNLACLQMYPRVQKLFLRLNSCLPSSAPVERLFSVGGLVMNPKRTRLMDRNFENLVLCKYNSHYL